MTDQQFWTIIESGGPKAQDDPERQLAAVRKKLAGLPPDEIRDFQRLFHEKLVAAYSWDLWGAAYVINGGCSDDGFHYFREWLISRGRATYEAAVQHPDSLAGLTEPDRDDYEFEDLGYVAHKVYEEQTGVEMVPFETSWPTEPKGHEWDFDDDEQVARKLPKLAAIYFG